VTFTPTSSYSFLPTLIERASEVMPDIALDLSEMATGDQVEALLNGQADIGLIRPPVAHSDLNSICVLEERLLVAVPHDNPLAAKERLSVEDISTQPFIMYSSGEARYFHDVVTSIFADSSVAPRYAQHVSQIHLMMSLVGAGMGCALVPESAQILHYDGVVLRPLVLERPRVVELYMVWRRDNEDPLIDRLVDCAPQAIMCAAE
jgi:DNA-binding transcriptional LysR family regulator